MRQCADFCGLSVVASASLKRNLCRPGFKVSAQATKGSTPGPLILALCAVAMLEVGVVTCC